MKRKTIAFLMSLVLIIGISGTFVIASEPEVSDVQEMAEVEQAAQNTAQEIADEVQENADTVIEEEPQDATPSLEEGTVQDNDGQEKGEEISSPKDVKKAPPHPHVKHIKGCKNKCKVVGCPCHCHYDELLNTVMACRSWEEYQTLMSKYTEEALRAFTASLTDNQIIEIELFLETIELEPLPPIIPEENPDEPVDKKIHYKTKKVIKPAPLKPPVRG